MGREGEKKRVGGDTDRDEGLRPRCEPGAMSLHIWGSTWTQRLGLLLSRFRGCLPYSFHKWIIWSLTDPPLSKWSRTGQRYAFHRRPRCSRKPRVVAASGALCSSGSRSVFSAYRKAIEFLVFVLFCLLRGGFLKSEEGELSS